MTEDSQNQIKVYFDNILDHIDIYGSFGDQGPFEYFNSLEYQKDELNNNNNFENLIIQEYHMSSEKDLETEQITETTQTTRNLDNQDTTETNQTKQITKTKRKYNELINSKSSKLIDEDTKEDIQNKTSLEEQYNTKRFRKRLKVENVTKKTIEFNSKFNLSVSKRYEINNSKYGDYISFRDIYKDIKCEFIISKEESSSLFIFDLKPTQEFDLFFLYKGNKIGFSIIIELNGTKNQDKVNKIKKLTFCSVVPVNFFVFSNYNVHLDSFKIMGKCYVSFNDKKMKKLKSNELFINNLILERINIPFVQGFLDSKYTISNMKVSYYEITGSVYLTLKLKESIKTLELQGYFKRVELDFDKETAELENLEVSSIKDCELFLFNNVITKTFISSDLVSIQSIEEFFITSMWIIKLTEPIDDYQNTHRFLPLQKFPIFENLKFIVPDRIKHIWIQDVSSYKFMNRPVRSITFERKNQKLKEQQVHIDVLENLIHITLND